MIDRNQFFLGHYSLRHTPAPERIAAAADAGFAGISVYWPEVAANADAPSSIKTLLDAAGLRASMLEIIRLPGAEALDGFATEAQRAARIAAELDCPTVLAVALDPTTEFSVVLRGFATLASACADAGRRCAFEFIPYISSIPDLATAVSLLRAVDIPCAGLVLDSLHFVRSGAPWAELAALEPHDIAGIQVCDGPLARPTTDYLVEAMTLRRPPGEGEFDLCRFLATLESAGASAQLTCEVISDELERLPSAQAARRMASATRALLRNL